MHRLLLAGLFGLFAATASAQPIKIGDLEAALDRDLVQSGAQALGKCLCVVMCPEMHEEESRVIFQHVVMKGCYSKA